MFFFLRATNVIKNAEEYKEPQNESKLHLTLRAPILISVYPDSTAIPVNNILLTQRTVLWGNSLVVHWLGLHTLSSKGLGSGD